MHDKLRKALYEISQDFINLDYVDQRYKEEFKDVVKDRSLIRHIKKKLDRYHWVEARAAFGILVLLEESDKKLDRVSWVHLARARAILGEDHVNDVLLRNKINPKKIKR